MKKSILLVEDDEVVRNMIKDALKKEYIVLEASRYSEGIKYLKNPVDLAIIDYDLPEKHGFEVLYALREAIPSLPAIIITAYSHEDLVIKAIRTGVTDYMKKPLSLKYMRSRLSEILEGHRIKEDPEIVESRDEFIMDGAALFIKENSAKELTRKTLMSMTRMSRNKFGKTFKNRFGLTFKAYLRKIRARNAVELLKNPDLSIKEIADITGHHSVTHFERVFRKEYRLSPQEYRKMCRTDRFSQAITT